ncbi:MAG: protein translocase subunit SecD [Victivallaceae bacterium]|nr:protein translocase subunit SecD [Victivallaceae bacterium]
MNKHFYLRAVVAAVVVGVFSFSIYPLTQRDFYETFRKLLKNPADTRAEKVIAEARKLQRGDIYPSGAMLLAADREKIPLQEMLRGKDLQDNRDAVALVRKHAASSIRLGLDLNGGVEFVLELVPEKAVDPESKEFAAKVEGNFDYYRDQAIEILRKRLEGEKIFETEITPMSGRLVSLKAPVVSKDEKQHLLNLIQMSAKLHFHLVHPQNDALVQEYLANPKMVIPVGYELMREVGRTGDTRERLYFVESRWKMDGKGITEAFPTQDQFGQRKIALRFNTKGAKDFGKVTTENVGRLLAIVLDGKLYCAPVLNEPILGGSAEISGSFSNEEMKNISNALASGGFPFQIKVNSVFDTDPTLGVENVRNGIRAGIFSLLAVVIFMCGYYLMAGFVAVFALAVNMLLLLGAMAAFGATLTMPGIAGLILTIGMAVDANVLIYERIREELASGKTLKNAIELGYSKAFSAVFDGNITTLITALILMKVGTGAVKGFAVALAIGIATSMFSALFVTRILFDFMTSFLKISQLKMCQFLDKPKIPFLKLSRYALILSGTLIVLSFVICGVRGSSMLGVDFTGGTMVSFNYSERIPVNSLEKFLAQRGIAAKVSYKSNASSTDNRKLEILIRGAVQSEQNTSPKDTLENMLNSTYPNAKLTGGQETSVGGLVGAVMTRSAVWAILFSFLGIIAYVSLRYEFSYSIAAIIALVHDVIISVGIFALTGREMSLPVVAAVLTIIGYSVNDTIVVFDRIRENVALLPHTPYHEVINASLNQTLSRTLLTSCTTLIVLIVLFFWGGIAINDFVFVMLLGVVIGTYSSLFIASPIISVWHRRNSFGHTGN